uniref:BED-type domain-containing protein n=1 Tax=Sinocyclocheilus grahami TaxID=75366 RepID=A0A672QSJ4_SINGR
MHYSMTFCSINSVSSAGCSVSAEKVNTEEPSVKKIKLPKFHDSYIKYGFMEYSDGRPQCTLCLKILSVEALKPYKLNRHLTTIHPEHANKSKDFFQRKKEEYIKQKVRLTNITTIPEKAQQASYLAALRIAKCQLQLREVKTAEMGAAHYRLLFHSEVRWLSRGKVLERIAATHCMLHRQALASKSMAPDLHDVLEVVVAAVNFVKSRPLKSRLFAKLCTEMGAAHDRLLFHSEVRWLSRGKVLERVFELRRELHEFLKEHKPDLELFFSDQQWMAKLAYLADIFSSLNGLNLSIQGCYSTILEASDKINAFRRNIDLWVHKLQRAITDMFPNLSEFLDTNCMGVDFMLNTITSHLTSLNEHFSHYFTDIDMEKYDWVRDPFSCEVMASGLSGKAKDELLELSSDRTLRMRFNMQGPAEFWPTVEKEYKEVALQAMIILYRARLNVEDDLRVCLSPITPRIDKLCKERQSHPSH